MTEQLEAKYGFANQLSALSNSELVDRVNAQVGNRGWGNARAYFLHCLRSELLSRPFECSCLVDNGGLQLGQAVSLVDSKLQFTNQKTPEEDQQ